MMDLKNLNRSFEILKVTKGVYLEGSLGVSLCEEFFPTLIEPAVELEVLIDNWIKKWFYISLDTGEILAERRYGWVKDVYQVYNEDREEWMVVSGQWFWFIGFDDLEENLTEKDIIEITERVDEIIKERWSF
jgi:hypothetical protein